MGVSIFRRCQAALAAARAAWHAPHGLTASSAADQARRHLERQNAILAALTEAVPATVVIVDAEGRYRFVNGAFAKQVGRHRDDIIGRSALDVLGADEVARRRPYMQRAFAGEAVSFTLDYPDPDGDRHLALHCIPLKLDGVVDGLVGISQDVTAQRREQERLARLAERDPLTGLLNRAGFELRVECGRVCAEGSQMALLYIDLDHFKPVNDSLGHGAGDQLLQVFGQRLIQAVRNTDVVARLGGDEFAILLCQVRDLSAARAVADKVLAAAARPFDIDGRSVQVGASVGLAMVDPRQHGLDELMARADRMLYQAKAAGRGRQASDDMAPAAACSPSHLESHETT